MEPIEAKGPAGQRATQQNIDQEAERRSALPPEIFILEQTRRLRCQSNRGVGPGTEGGTEPGLQYATGPAILGAS